MEFEFRVVGTLRSGNDFRTEVIVIAADLEEAKSELGACFDDWEVVGTWQLEALLDERAVAPKSRSAALYAEGGAFSVYDPDLGNARPG